MGMPMQWLIDIVAARVLEQTGYRDRGDAASTDFSLGDLNNDGNWHELDLSTIVPEGANLIKIEVVLIATTANRNIQMRTPGNVNANNRAANVMQTSTRNHEEVLLVQPDAGRVVEYRTDTNFTGTLILTIGGWWLGPLNLVT